VPSRRLDVASAVVLAAVTLHLFHFLFLAG
jgi:hypothetical protein